MNTDTIVAVSTPAGTGGIAIVRMSGAKAIAIAADVCRRKSLLEYPSHTAHLVDITLDDNGTVLDNGVVTIFRGPRSFTGEDIVEFGVHGSRYIQKELLRRLVEKGCRPATGGEFSQRAFLNRRIDLAQAESIADLIAAESAAAHRLAMNQLKGDFSARLDTLREKLIEFASLLELELDFSEEDVEFADRTQLLTLCEDVKEHVDKLAQSFRLGNAFKSGIPVAIVGQPNAGKSTLLNKLLGEDRAIVSDIPGTTRDTIEDTMVIDGILFRFIDTAGLRDTSDEIEMLGIERTRAALSKASIVLWLIDPSGNVADQTRYLEQYQAEAPSYQHIIPTGAKNDLYPSSPIELTISAKTGNGIGALKGKLSAFAREGHNPESELMVTNERHHTSLCCASESLGRALTALHDNISGDLIAQDIREAIAHLSAITGAITTDTLLHTIFSRFCVGK